MRWKVDHVDVQIVELLQGNARLSCAAIGKEVSLARSAVWERLKRLERIGLILGYEAVVAPSAVLADIDFVVFLKIKCGPPQGLCSFEAELRTMGATLAAWRVAGSERSYWLRVGSRQAVLWIENAAAKHGLVVDELSTAAVIEEIVTRRAPLILKGR